MRLKYFGAITAIHKKFRGKLKDSLAWDNETKWSIGSSVNQTRIGSDNALTSVVGHIRSPDIKKIIFRTFDN